MQQFEPSSVNSMIYVCYNGGWQKESIKDRGWRESIAGRAFALYAADLASTSTTLYGSLSNFRSDPCGVKP